MAFDVNVSTIAYVEHDDYRAEQIEYIIGKLFDSGRLDEIKD